MCKHVLRMQSQLEHSPQHREHTFEASNNVHPALLAGRGVDDVVDLHAIGLLLLLVIADQTGGTTMLQEGKLLKILRAQVAAVVCPCHMCGGQPALAKQTLQEHVLELDVLHSSHTQPLLGTDSSLGITPHLDGHLLCESLQQESPKPQALASTTAHRIDLRLR